MSRLQIIRTSDNKTDSTIGTLYLDGVKLCVILEPGSERAQHSCIKAGTYKIDYVKEGEVYGWMQRQSQFAKDNGVLVVLGIEGRSGIEHHIGNSCIPNLKHNPPKPFGDSLGCALYGTTANDNTKQPGYISGSTTAYEKVAPIVHNYWLTDADKTIDYIDN